MKKLVCKGAVIALLIPLALLAAEAIKVTVALKHRDVRSILARVSEELGPKGHISVDGQRNRITVEDEPANIKKVTLLLKQLDQPAKRFALAARLEVFPAPQQKGFFAEKPGFIDMSSFVSKTKPEKSFEGLVNLREGGSGSAQLGPDYSLTVSAGGYDPSQRRLNMNNLSLWMGKDPDRKAVLSGGATLPEGQMTSLVIGSEKEHPPLKLNITPNLLPDLEQREIPR